MQSRSTLLPTTMEINPAMVNSSGDIHQHLHTQSADFESAPTSLSISPDVVVGSVIISGSLLFIVVLIAVLTVRAISKRFWCKHDQQTVDQDLGMSNQMFLEVEDARSRGSDQRRITFAE